METLKTKIKDMSLRSFLVMTVCLALAVVVLASALIIAGCSAFRHWLLPDPDSLYLTVEETFSDGRVTQSTYLLHYGNDPVQLPTIKIDGIQEAETARQTRYSIEKIETGLDSLSPKRKLAYQACGAVMFAAPTVLAFAAILWCGMFFYRRKLKAPLTMLARATEQITEQNLDFTLSYPCGDELGRLCGSFEEMRAALAENHRAMWSMLEERQLMQASVAHDLRNPIAIIQGYTEYLENCLADGEVHREKITHIAQNLKAAAKRLELYTESVRLLNQWETAQPSRKPLNARMLAADVVEDLDLLAKPNGIILQAVNRLPDQDINVDKALLSRIMENIVGNGLRYATEQIQLVFSICGDMLHITVTDDGPGFPPEILQKQEKIILAGEDRENGHLGIGLSISRLLCRKHGGRLELSNTPDGACVKIFLAV